VKLTITPVWEQVTPHLSQELIAFWRDNNAIVDQARAATRATQAVCIARDEADVICGVGTAMIRVLPRLLQPMYYYRQYFAKAMRGRHQLIPFYQRARQTLQAHNASLEAPESLGVLIETENSKLSSAYNHAYEPSFAATFIGYSPRGAHMYVSYFDGAILQPPTLAASIPAGRGMNTHTTTATSPAHLGRTRVQS
jgi:hypothetical protein